jgi:site-specific recombinase XerD
LKMKPAPVISDDELAALLKACNGREFADRRDEALIRLLLDCGVQISEACGLRVDDLDLDQGMAIVKGKGNKARPIYFGARTARALDRYVRMRTQHRWAHLDALFLIQRGALSPDGARERVTLRGQLAGLARTPAPIPAYVRPRLPDERRTRARPETAGRLVVGCDAGTLRGQCC